MKNSIQFKEDLNSNTDNIILGILQLDMCKLLPDDVLVSIDNVS